MCETIRTTELPDGGGDNDVEPTDQSVRVVLPTAAAAAAADQDRPTSVIKDVAFIQEHYSQYFDSLTIESEDEANQLCVFSVTSKTELGRRVELSLSPGEGFKVLRDASAAAPLDGQCFESIEQVLSAMDGGGFSDLLCGLVAGRLDGLAAERAEDEDEAADAPLPAAADTAAADDDATDDTAASPDPTQGTQTLSLTVCLPSGESVSVASILASATVQSLAALVRRRLGSATDHLLFAPGVEEPLPPGDTLLAQSAAVPDGATLFALPAPALLWKEAHADLEISADALTVEKRGARSGSRKGDEQQSTAYTTAVASPLLPGGMHVRVDSACGAGNMRVGLAVEGSLGELNERLNVDRLKDKSWIVIQHGYLCGNVLSQSCAAFRTGDVLSLRVEEYSDPSEEDAEFFEALRVEVNGSERLPGFAGFRRVPKSAVLVVGLHDVGQKVTIVPPPDWDATRGGANQ